MRIDLFPLIRMESTTTMSSLSLWWVQLVEESNARCEFRWSCNAEITGNVVSLFTMASVPPEIRPQNHSIDRGNPDPNESKPALFPILSLSEKQFQSFCGISISAFQYLLYRGGDDLKDARVLSREQKLAIFFVKLKLNCSFLVLGAVDNLVRQTDYSSPNTIPKQFRDVFPETRVLIDASEIECSRLNPNKKRVQMSSNYEGRFTVKFLIGCALSGEITFISKGFGGRSTDAEITVKIGFRQYIEEGDVVLADKGFPHIQTKIGENGGTLVRPPFKRGGVQFSSSENEDGYQIAKVRVHVE